jgi:hypothetical protein
VCKGCIPVGPRGGQSAKSPSRSARFYVGLTRGFVHTCLHERGKAKVLEAESHGRPTTWLGRPTTWRVTDLTKLVIPPWTPINTPLPVEIRTHTPHFGDFTCKALILSVVARRSLIGSPPRSSSAEALPESFRVRKGFSTLVCSSAEALSESYGF